MRKKVPGPPRKYSTPLKFQKRPAPWNYNSAKFINPPSPPDFREGSYHVSLYTSQKTRI